MCEIKESSGDGMENVKKTGKLLGAYHFVEGDEAFREDEVLYIETKGHKNYFHLTDGRIFSIYRKLDELEQDFSGMDFLRCHQSYLVNMHYIDKISSYVLTLTSGEQLSVPKARYKEVKKQFSAYCKSDVLP